MPNKDVCPWWIKTKDDVHMLIKSDSIRKVYIGDTGLKKAEAKLSKKVNKWDAKKGGRR